jgi:hypothetical protein
MRRAFREWGIGGYEGRRERRQRTVENRGRVRVVPACFGRDRAVWCVRALLLVQRCGVRGLLPARPQLVLEVWGLREGEADFVVRYRGRLDTSDARNVRMSDVSTQVRRRISSDIGSMTLTDVKTPLVNPTIGGISTGTHSHGYPNEQTSSMAESATSRPSLEGPERASEQ